jgi:hypothetical protein
MRIPQSPDRSARGIDARHARSFNASAGTLDETAAIMRPLIALLSLPLFVVTAHARPSGGSKGGGGALGGVSAGLGSASSGGSSSAASSGSGNRHESVDERIAEVCYDGTGRVIDQHDTDECYRPIVRHDGNMILVKRRPRIEPPRPAAQFTIYAGAQKVHDSDGSASLELAVIDRRLRLNATFSRYFERQTGSDALTMTMPTLTGGLRIDDMGKTAVYLEGGVVHVRTDGDVMGDTKITGPIAGLRIEHPLDSAITLLGDVQQMWFDNDIKATSGRVGVRYKFVQASFRVLDFNVGPALYGPEVGVRF